jgi:polar amino acid transport system substrate-binding protein
MPTLPKALLWILLATPLATQVQASETSTITVFADENYPPVIYRDQQQPTGFLADVLHYVAKAQGQPIQLILYPWKRAYVSAEYGKGGVVGVSKTAPRELLFDFSAPIYHDDILVVVMKGHEFAFENLNDLHGKKIGAQLGASYGTEADILINSQTLNVERDQSQTARLGKLLRGRIEAAFIGNGQAGLDALLNSDPELKAHRDEFVALHTPLTRDTLYLAFNKGMHMQDYLQRFNQTLKQARIEHKLPELAD